MYGNYVDPNDAALSFAFIFLAAFMAIAAISLVFSFVYFIVAAIPYFIMARKAGFKHAWLAFIPYGQYYVIMTLPHREFNIFNKFKTNNRKKAFWAYVIVAVIATVIGIVNSFLDDITELLSTLAETASSESIFIYLIFMLLCLGVALIIMVISLANSFVAYLIRWRAHYDLLMTYDMQDHAMWASIVSLFVPLVIVVFSFIIMNKEPEYGFGNYYVDSDIYLS